MTSLRFVSHLVVLLAVAGPWAVSPALGQPSMGAPAPVPPMKDATLRPGGVLVGQLVNPQGAPLAKVRVSLQDDQGREVAAAVTDDQGYFVVQGVRMGVHQIVTPQGRWFYRFWTQETAPPSAQLGALLVTEGETVLGAPPRSSLKFWLTNPIVVGGVVATAIAVPVALSHHSPASP